MRKVVNRKLTICELCREINDVHQGDSETDKFTRQKLSEITERAKRMVKKLEEYKQGTKKELFPEKNPDYRKDKKFRKRKEYIRI